MLCVRRGDDAKGGFAECFADLRHPRIEAEIANHLSFIVARLAGRDFLVGVRLTGADIQMSFVGDVAGARADRAAYPNVDRWIRGLHRRPAWQVALQKGGVYAFAN